MEVSEPRGLMAIEKDGEKKGKESTNNLEKDT